MKQWFQSLSSRERVYVVAGSILLTIYLFWQMAWFPLVQQYQTLSQNVEKNYDLVQWMQQSSQKVHALQGKNGVKKQRSKSPIGIAEMLLKKYALNSKKPRMDPKGNNGIKIQLKEIKFDQLMRLFDDFEQVYGFICTEASITASSKKGVVDARFTVVR
jgi:type II secretory pathway component PulM